MKKKFIVLGNQNAVICKEIFPLIKSEELWLGTDCVRWFKMPDGTEKEGARSRWFTNLEHKKRHYKMDLYKLWSRCSNEYLHYDNYDAIEVDKTCDIPLGYKGVLGVPITFLDKYCPEQFEILGMCENEDLYNLKTRVYTTQETKAAYEAIFGKKGVYDLNASGVVFRNNRLEKVYARILIRFREGYIKEDSNGQT